MLFGGRYAITCIMGASILLSTHVLSCLELLSALQTAASIGRTASTLWSVYRSAQAFLGPLPDPCNDQAMVFWNSQCLEEHFSKVYAIQPWTLFKQSEVKGIVYDYGVYLEDSKPTLAVNATVPLNNDTLRRMWYYRSSVCVVMMLTMGVPFAAGCAVLAGNTAMFASVLAKTCSAIALGNICYSPRLDTVQHIFHFQQAPSTWRYLDTGRFLKSGPLSNDEWRKIVSLVPATGYTQCAVVDKALARVLAACLAAH